MPDVADTIFAERSSAGKIFGTSGGVMEAAIRTAYHMITGKELAELNCRSVRGMEGIKEASVVIDGLTVNVAVASGLNNARRLLDEIQKGLRQYHFIEVMTCPGGCIAGGGQPHFTDPARIRSRMQALYEIDRKADVRCSHKNESVRRIYAEFLEKPLSHMSHQLLHTHYRSRQENG
jgi:iron only hydrogenase large subunit-like protein